MSNRIIVKGSAWHNDTGLCRSAFRSRRRSTDRDMSLGLHLALDGTKKSPAPESGRGKP